MEGGGGWHGILAWRVIILLWIFLLAPDSRRRSDNVHPSHHGVVARRFCVDQVLSRADVENWHVTKVLCDCRAIKHLTLHRSVCQLRLWYFCFVRVWKKFDVSEVAGLFNPPSRYVFKYYQPWRLTNNVWNVNVIQIRETQDGKQFTHQCWCLPQYRSQFDVPSSRRGEWRFLQACHWEPCQKAEGNYYSVDTFS